MKTIGKLAIGAFAVLFAGPGAFAATEIKVGHGHTEKHSFHIAMEKFGEILEQKAPGAFTVSIFPHSQLGSEREMQEQLTTGSLEITITGVLGIYEPKLSLLELPYLFRDREHIIKVQHSDAVAQLTASLPPKGLRLIGFLENGFRHVTNNVRPVEKPEDMKALKMRTPENAAQIETFKALGASPTPMPSSELYAALRQGVVDGQENPLQNISDFKFFEVQKHLALTGHIYNSGYVAISESFYQGLPEEQRKAVAEAIDEACLWQFNLVASQDVEFLKSLKEKGMQVTEPDSEAFRKATAPAYDVFYEKYGEDAKAFVDAVNKL